MMDTSYGELIDRVELALDAFRYAPNEVQRGQYARDLADALIEAEDAGLKIRWDRDDLEVQHFEGDVPF